MIRSASLVLVAALSASARAQDLPAAVCQLELRPSAQLQGHYPPGPRRRNETGVVVLEFKVAVSSRRPIDVSIVGKSGNQDLDEAALKIGRAFTVTTDCLDATVRRAIHFEKEPDPPRSAGTTDFVLLGETYIWVEDL
jgi:TonB family protein